MAVIIKIIVIIPLLILNTKSQEKCEDKVTCADCMQLINCTWCIRPLGETHCLKNDLNDLYCQKDMLVTPNSSLLIQEDQQIQSDIDSLNLIQLKPQKIKIKLQRGETFVIPFQFVQASNVPIDLYYIMDLSSSMEPYRKSLAELGQKLEETMKSITTNFRIGFGSFVDKTDMPFISTVPSTLAKPCVFNGTDCVPAYSFKNHLSLSNDGRFSEQVLSATVSANLDNPEGGFDALMQAMVCDDEIGWRNDSRRLIIFSTDALFHMAGDGKLAGVVEPNDAKCHMKNNKYIGDLIYDYPSISQINYVAKAKAMNIFFAIVDRYESTYETYEKLKNAIENSHVSRLNEKRGNNNIVRLIVEFYQRISSKVIMGPTLVNRFISINYTSDCKSQELYGCSDIHVKDVINFKASIRVDECTADDNVYNFKINPSGYSDSLDVELEVTCNCDCEKSGNTRFIKNSDECSNQGDLKCGVCDCLHNKVGKKCQCDKDGETLRNDHENTELCRNGNDTDLCSGFGICICGQCQCLPDDNQNKRYSGRYCHCDDYSCRQEDGKVCSGNGDCICGKCKCKTEWIGDTCECQNMKSPCVLDGVMCSKNGKCVCDKCICNENYTGEFCEKNPNSAGGKLCEILKPCVECKVFNYGLYKDNCANNCSIYNISVDVMDIDSEIYEKCRLDSKDGCRIEFKYYSEDKQVFIEATNKLICPNDVKIIALVFGVIGSIVLAGIIMMLIWKCVTVVHDKREYIKFEKEKEKLNWNRNDNPLFKTPVTKFLNPTFGLNRMSVKSD